MKSRFITCLLGVCLAMFAIGLCSSTYAASGETSVANSSNNQWRFLIAPYGWLPWMSGDITVKGQSAKVDIAPQDLIKTLDAAFQIHVEAAKGNWAFMVDPTYVKLKESVNSSGPMGNTIGADTIFEMTLVDFGVYYRFLNTLINGNPNSSISLETLLGGRYMKLENTIKLNLNQQRVASVSGDKSWIDPIIGGRLQYHINKFWSAIMDGDIGGFGVGSHFTWSARLVGVYHFNKTFGSAFGVRALGVNYSEGHGSNKFKMDVTQYGPVVGLTIRF